MNEKVYEYTKKHFEVYGTIGFHPHNADNVTKDDFELMKQQIESNEKIVAVGECGLDYDRMFSTKENQIRCLEKHIILAKQLNMPLFLHERSAAEDFIRRFKAHQGICSQSVVHCFTGNKATLEKYLDLGFYIGITGWICDEKRGKDLRDAVKIIPLDRILLETDAPYLTPKIDGLSRTNVPENITYVADELAKHMKVEKELLIDHANKNTERLFKLKET